MRSHSSRRNRVVRGIIRSKDNPCIHPHFLPLIHSYFTDSAPFSKWRERGRLALLWCMNYRVRLRPLFHFFSASSKTSRNLRTCNYAVSSCLLSCLFTSLWPRLVLSSRCLFSHVSFRHDCYSLIISWQFIPLLLFLQTPVSPFSSFLFHSDSSVQLNSTPSTE